MKNSFLGIALLICLPSFAQEPEFAKSTNGLIYSDITISQLKHIVDSLNIKFRVCDLHKIYRAKAQAKGNYISLKTGDIKAARRDIESNISFDDFIKKYPASTVQTDLLVVKFTYKNYLKKAITEFSGVEFGKNANHNLYFDTSLEQYKLPLKGRWVLKYKEKTTYVDESIDAFYFTTDFSEPALPEKYARLVQYADCMVDTTVEIFREKARSSGGLFYRIDRSAVNAFLNYVQSKLEKAPELRGKYSQNRYEKYSQKFKEWDSLRLVTTDNLYKNDTEFKERFQIALKAALDSGISNNDFEEYVERYDSKKTSLELKRNRKVMGSCSMDNSPRIHAMNIALLSAETVNWEIFLRSHLDIMNDKFERVSDGSYAWAARQTYIRELEVLDINVADLLLGISLRVENAGDHHYYGSIGRLGRALSESEQRDKIQKRILQMISDDELDDYNRVLMYYLFLNYCHYLEDADEKKQNIDTLKLAVSTLPEYIYQRISFK